VIEDLPTYGLHQDGVLCLWGSGYRAALFHLGALTRLNELGLLAGLETVGAAAGGSILAALLTARVPWPLEGAYRAWPEAIAEPMRVIASRNAQARALLRGAIAGSASKNALEERYARELAAKAEADHPERPRFIFGGAGIALGEIPGSSASRGGVRWEIGASTTQGYDATLVADVIATVRTDLDAFGEAEQAVLENHGYLLADAGLRDAEPERLSAVEPLPPEPPHPRWMNPVRVREALAASSQSGRFGRLRPRREGRRRSATELSGGEVEALLERHRPIVQYDSLESYRADSVAAVTSLAMGRRCNTLRRGDGTSIAATLGQGDDVARLDLDFLGPTVYANGMAVRADDYLEESGGTHAADAQAMRRRQGFADVVYGRAVEDREGRRWLQYFFFYYYNDKGLLNLGLHEGDWEMVQLLIGAGGSPEAVTFAQHAGAERAAWSEVERRGDGGGEALVVYCARGSHASLSCAGTYWAPIVPDHNDGRGAAVRPRLVKIGADAPGWASWPGRWGATRRRQAFEGSSPLGPAQQPQWWDPGGFHKEARTKGDARPWTCGRPPAAELNVRRGEGQAVVVDYRFPASIGDAARPARILSAPYDLAADEPSRTQVFGVQGREGSFVLRLPPGGHFDGICFSAISDRGAPGETLAVPFND
jgi:hypothetical protein